MVYECWAEISGTNMVMHSVKCCYKLRHVFWPFPSKSVFKQHLSRNPRKFENTTDVCAFNNLHLHINWFLIRKAIRHSAGSWINDKFWTREKITIACNPTWTQWSLWAFFLFFQIGKKGLLAGVDICFIFNLEPGLVIQFLEIGELVCCLFFPVNVHSLCHSEPGYANKGFYLMKWSMHVPW